MAIKDQCAKCRFFSENRCSNTSAQYVFDQRSCEFYSRSSINLDKKEECGEGISNDSKNSINLDKPDSTRMTNQERPIPTPTIGAPASPQVPPVNPTTASKPQEQRMFAHPFSFEGRIRRTELWLSYIVGYIFCIAAGFVLGACGLYDEGFEWIIMIPYLWFMYAQLAKRCHDRDNSGWYILIPFYIFWLLFADGDPYENSYGQDPKGRNIYA